MGDSCDRLPAVGREEELLRLGRFVEKAGSGRSIVLIGGAGIRKTVLWDAAIDGARDGGMHVLTARPSGAVAQLPLGGVIDLCDRLDDAALSVSAPPLRHALEVVLMRVAPEAEPAPPSAVALGLLGVVRALAARDPVVIAIDEPFWRQRGGPVMRPSCNCCCARPSYLPRVPALAVSEACLRGLDLRWSVRGSPVRGATGRLSRRARRRPDLDARTWPTQVRRRRDRGRPARP